MYYVYLFNLLLFCWRFAEQSTYIIAIYHIKLDECQQTAVESRQDAGHVVRIQLQKTTLICSHRRQHITWSRRRHWQPADTVDSRISSVPVVLFLAATTAYNIKRSLSVDNTRLYGWRRSSLVGWITATRRLFQHVACSPYKTRQLDWWQSVSKMHALRSTGHCTVSYRRICPRIVNGQTLLHEHARVCTSDLLVQLDFFLIKYLSFYLSIYLSIYLQLRETFLPGHLSCHALSCHVMSGRRWIWVE